MCALDQTRRRADTGVLAHRYVKAPPRTEWDRTPALPRFPTPLRGSAPLRRMGGLRVRVEGVPLHEGEEFLDLPQGLREVHVEKAEEPFELAHLVE